MAQRRTAHILALLPLLLSSVQSAHPHPPLTSGGSGGAGGVGPAPADGGGPFEYSYEYRNSVNGTNATAATDIGNATNVVGYDLNSATAEASAVVVDSYAGSVSFLYRNRRQKRRNLRRRFLQGGE